MCLLQCSITAEDSIEHYCRCPVVKQAMTKVLRLDPYYYANIHTLMLVNTHVNTIEDLTTIALLTYGIYTTTNTLRKQTRAQQSPAHAAPAQPGEAHSDPHPTTERLQTTCPQDTFAYDMLLQNIRRGAMGHRKAAATLDT